MRWRIRKASAIFRATQANRGAEGKRRELAGSEFAADHIVADSSHHRHPRSAVAVFIDGMDAVHTAQPMPEEAPADVPPLAERKDWRMVPCSRCRAPLYFPASSADRSRIPYLFCRKCGGRTSLPTMRRRIFQIIGVLIFLAACAYVIFTFIKEG
jgi:hypothetical protein